MFFSLNIVITEAHQKNKQKTYNSLHIIKEPKEFSDLWLDFMLNLC